MRRPLHARLYKGAIARAAMSAGNVPEAIFPCAKEMGGSARIGPSFAVAPSIWSNGMSPGLTAAPGHLHLR
jgi:hypothetical protein